MFAEDPCPLLLLGQGRYPACYFCSALVLLICVASSWVDWADWHHLREFTAPQAWYTAATKTVHEYRDGNTGHFTLPVTHCHRRENSMVIPQLESEVTAVAGNGLCISAGRLPACSFKAEKWTRFPMLALEDLERWFNSKQAELVIRATSATEFC